MNPLTIFSNRPRVLPLVALLTSLGVTGLAQAQARYRYSDDGAEVSDAKTGLVWRRCSQGQSWSAGTCSGSATTYTHEQALALVKTQTGWRLPNVKELSSLVERSRVSPSAYFSDRGRSFQRDRGRCFKLIVDAQGCAQARN